MTVSQPAAEGRCVQVRHVLACLNRGVCVCVRACGGGGVSCLVIKLVDVFFPASIAGSTGLCLQAAAVTPMIPVLHSVCTLGQVDRHIHGTQPSLHLC